MAEVVSAGNSSGSMWGVHHVHHHFNPRRHRDPLGRVRVGKWDNVCFIGWFADRASAESAVQSVKTQPGFVDEPDCFVVLDYPLDADLWPLGFKPALRRKKS